MICPRSYSKCDQAELQTEVNSKAHSLPLVTVHFPMTVPRAKVKRQSEVVPFTKQVIEKAGLFHDILSVRYLQDVPKESQ